MSKCENCIYYERCDHYHIATDTGKYAYQNIDLDRRDDVEEICDDFKDKSLCVELLCKVGDKVYQADVERIYESTINEIDITTNKVIYCAENVCFDETAIGKSVFLTKEKAERKLREVGE